MNRIQHLVMFVAVAALLWSCRDIPAAARSMGQVYQEEGIPVRVLEIAPETFEKRMSYHVTLSGIRETSAYAGLGDRIEKIHVSVGDLVEKDQIVAEFPTDSPGAQYRQAKVAFDHAKTTYQRLDSLYRAGGISLQELDNAKTAFEVEKANWDAVRQVVKVQAPISGMVTKVVVHETDFVERDQELLTIADVRRLKARLGVPETEISSISVGSPAFAQWLGKTISGKVTAVDLGFDPSRQTFGVDVEFDNSGFAIQPGLTVEVHVSAYRQEGAIVLHRKHLIFDREDGFVFLAQDGFAEKRGVTLGRSRGLDVEILDGVKAGDLVVVEGQLNLTDGAKISIVE